MKVTETELKGVLLITLNPFEDFRGHFVELYREDTYARTLGIKFVEDDISVSRKGVLRGIHVDSEAWKLLTCLHGTIYLVIVNKDFDKWQSFTLSDSSTQILVPPKYGIAHLVLSHEAILHYKQSLAYDLSRQSTYRFDDPRLGIFWPIRNPILSRRDDPQVLGLPATLTEAIAKGYEGRKGIA